MDWKEQSFNVLYDELKHRSDGKAKENCDKLKLQSDSTLHIMRQIVHLYLNCESPHVPKPVMKTRCSFQVQ